MNFLKYYFPLIFWMVLIFYFSSIPNLNSGLEEDFILRKIAHIFEYFILSWLFFRLFAFYNLETKQAFYLTVLLAFSYAVFDELHQVFVQSREGRLIDILWDSVGILIFSFLFKRF